MRHVRRRALILGALAAPALAFGRPDPPKTVKAVFEEMAGSVQFTTSIPKLFPKTDYEAFASIDSGFDTTLEYEIDLWVYGTRRKVASRTVIVKVTWDLWKKKYVVRTKGTTGWVRRTFGDRDAAIEAAVTLDRIRICDAALLERGSYEEGPFYYVTVLALRNPIRTAGAAAGRRRTSDRDVEWFGRLVESLASERPRAEEIVNVRTNPFYLPQP